LIALPTSNAEHALQDLDLPRFQIDFDLNCLAAGGVMHHGPLALAGFLVEPVT